MKLIFAGTSSVYALNYRNFLFNCKRNAACQKFYFIPLRSTNELFFYADFPGKPSAIKAEVFDPCCMTGVENPGEYNDDFGDDWNIGGLTEGDCSNTDILFDKYVVGQTPVNSWYGVFKTSQDFRAFHYLYFRFTFTIGETDYVYYSEMFELENCAPLSCIRSCYPNEEAGADAWDCNGIYYGLHAGPEEALGDEQVRYFHQACVRRGKIIPASAKLNFTLFNSKRNYKTVLQRESKYEFELVPNFYKDFLLSLFIRGNIEVDGSRYVLQTEQGWKPVDEDSGLWALDTIVFDECKAYFGCQPPDCLPPAPPCVNSIAQDEWTYNEGYFEQPFTGSMKAGETLQWEILDENRLPVLNGLIPASSDLVITDSLGNVTPAIKCYFLRWRIVCRNGFSQWKENKFGECNPQPTALQMTLSAYSFGSATDTPDSNQCSAQGATKMRFRFAEPTAQDITVQIATLLIFTNGSGAGEAYGGDIIPAGHSQKANFSRGDWQGSSGAHVPFTVTIPAGSTDYLTARLLRPHADANPVYGVTEGPTSVPACNPYSWEYSYYYYFKVTSPAGVEFAISAVYDTPQPWNIPNGSIKEAAQII